MSLVLILHYRIAEFWLLINCHYNMVKQILCKFILDSILLYCCHMFGEINFSILASFLN